jgi:hypothetical protein
MDGVNSASNTLKKSRILMWLIGLGSLAWLLLRSGTNPRRLAYPCQRAALFNSLTFLGFPTGIAVTSRLYRQLKRKPSLWVALLFLLALFVTINIKGSVFKPQAEALADINLPSWTSSTAISNVFAVQDVPIPQCSLDGGQLQSTPPCNDPSFSFHDDGVDALLDSMEAKGDYFYKTTSHPTGILGSNDVVVIKINNQWGGRGTGDGIGRLATNTDVLKGLIWRILQHPEGFTGEIVIAENAQPTSTNNWDVTPANAEDQGQSFKDVVTAFQSKGYPVSLYDWTNLNNSRINGGSLNNSGYPNGEYIKGNMDDGYVMIDDPETPVINELSYPKFRTANNNYVSMRYGVWEGNRYNPARLTMINLPVLKRHGMAGATISWKNLIGFISAEGYSNNRFGGYNEMHDFFWGYTKGNYKNYGLIGRQLAYIKSPDLNIVEAIWVPFQSNFSGNAVRENILLASTDPFAVDWFASEYVLYPITGDYNTSAARGGEFRDATRVNQNSAQLAWQVGAYPYIDLLDNYDGTTVSQAEKDQLNVFVTSPGTTLSSITLNSPDGGEVWRTGSQHTVQWTSIGNITKIDLSYSTDGFNSDVHSIASSIGNTGSYTWTLPDHPIDNVVVRVSDDSNPAVFDDSDRAFVISDFSHFTFIPISINK